LPAARPRAIASCHRQIAIPDCGASPARPTVAGVTDWQRSRQLITAALIALAAG
jgi:hypothetical protein